METELRDWPAAVFVSDPAALTWITLPELLLCVLGPWEQVYQNLATSTHTPSLCCWGLLSGNQSCSSPWSRSRGSSRHGAHNSRSTKCSRWTSDEFLGDVGELGVASTCTSLTGRHR